MTAEVNRGLTAYTDRGRKKTPGWIQARVTLLDKYTHYREMVPGVSEATWG